MMNRTELLENPIKLMLTEYGVVYSTSTFTHFDNVLVQKEYLLFSLAGQVAGDTSSYPSWVRRSIPTVGVRLSGRYIVLYERLR